MGVEYTRGVKGRVKMKTVNDIWINFWSDIVGNPPDMEQVKRELYDYWQVMQRVPKVYDYCTGGMTSNILVDADVVIRLINEHYKEYYEEGEDEVD